MAKTYPGAHDIDTDEVASLLRNLAHGIEEGDIPLTAVESTTEVEADETFVCEFALTYTPSDESLIPAKRLTDDD